MPNFIIIAAPIYLYSGIVLPNEVLKSRLKKEKYDLSKPTLTTSGMKDRWSSTSIYPLILDLSFLYRRYIT